MNRLSTPTARTRKGMTSAIMRVTLIPTKEKNATDDDTERITRPMPNKPSVNLEPTKRLRGKRGKTEGIFLESTEKEEEVRWVPKNSFGKLRAHRPREDITSSSSRPSKLLPKVRET